MSDWWIFIYILTWTLFIGVAVYLMYEGSKLIYKKLLQYREKITNWKTERRYKSLRKSYDTHPGIHVDHIGPVPFREYLWVFLILFLMVALTIGLEKMLFFIPEGWGFGSDDEFTTTRSIISFVVVIILTIYFIGKWDRLKKNKHR